MAVTVSDARTVLESRAHGLLVALGISVVTDEANPALDGPLTWGFQRVGIVPSEGLVVSDPDLDGPSTGKILRGIDYAEYRLLMDMTMSDVFVDTKVGNGSMMLSQLYDGLERRIARTEKRLGVALRPLVGGSLVKRLSTSILADELGLDGLADGSP
jgi:hypothetical protein